MGLLLKKYLMLYRPSAGKLQVGLDLCYSIDWSMLFVRGVVSEERSAKEPHSMVLYVFLTLERCLVIQDHSVTYRLISVQ